MSRRDLPLGWDAASLQLLAWLTYGVVHFLASLPAVQEGEVAMLAVMRAVKAGTGLLVSASCGIVLHRLSGPDLRSPWSAGALLVAIAGTVWMVVDRVVLVALAPASGKSIPWHSVPRGVDLEYYFVMAAWAAAVISFRAVAQARSLREELLQRELDTRDARLYALVTQLNPHFLFNALNAIRSRMAESPAAARVMLTQLADLLRRMLDVDTGTRIPLARELEFVHDFLAIQAGRFESTLQASVTATPEARAAMVPPLILQPIVENAVKFGGHDATGVLHVAVAAAVRDGALELCVENTGTLATAERTGAVGLTLTRRRLEALGPGHVFTLEEHHGTVRAWMRLPSAPA